MIKQITYVEYNYRSNGNLFQNQHTKFDGYKTLDEVREILRESHGDSVEITKLHVTKGF